MERRRRVLDSRDSLHRLFRDLSGDPDPLVRKLIAESTETAVTPVRIS